jgi:hypothetical protein
MKPSRAPDVPGRDRTRSGVICLGARWPRPLEEANQQEAVLCLFPRAMVWSALRTLPNPRKFLSVALEAPRNERSVQRGWVRGVLSSDVRGLLRCDGNLRLALTRPTRDNRHVCLLALGTLAPLAWEYRGRCAADKGKPSGEPKNGVPRRRSPTGCDRTCCVGGVSTPSSRPICDREGPSTWNVGMLCIGPMLGPLRAKSKPVGRAFSSTPGCARM